MPRTILPRSFYLRPTLDVARDLLGRHIVRRLNGGRLEGRIVEVEAYLGAADPASHSYRGKTLRNEVMFRTGGHLYVYFTYGMHFCSNIVTEEEGTGNAVLIRAVEPLRGMDVMAGNRKKPAGGSRRSTEPSGLTDGPAKFCQAFGIGRAQNGTDLLGGEIFLKPGEPVPGPQVGRSVRVGIRAAVEKRWRFYVRGNPFVSRKG